MNCEELRAWADEHSADLGALRVSLNSESCGIYTMYSIASGNIDSLATITTPPVNTAHVLEGAKRDAARLWDTPLDGRSDPVPVGTVAYTVHGTPPPPDYWPLQILGFVAGFVAVVWLMTRQRRGGA